jgi:hypothetical protein
MKKSYNRRRIWQQIKKRFQNRNYPELLGQYFELAMAERAIEQDQALRDRISDRRGRVEKILEYFRAHKIEV